MARNVVQSGRLTSGFRGRRQGCALLEHRHAHAAAHVPRAPGPRVVHRWVPFKDDVVVLLVHSHSFLSPVWSPDGLTFVSADKSGEIRLWDPKTGTAKVPLRPVPPSLLLVSSSPHSLLIHCVCRPMYVGRASRCAGTRSGSRRWPSSRCTPTPPARASPPRPRTTRYVKGTPNSRCTSCSEQLVHNALSLDRPRLLVPHPFSTPTHVPCWGRSRCGTCARGRARPPSPGTRTRSSACAGAAWACSTRARGTAPSRCGPSTDQVPKTRLSSMQVFSALVQPHLTTHLTHTERPRPRPRPRIQGGLSTSWCGRSPATPTASTTWP